MSYVEIAGRKIGPGYSTYIVADLSCNHKHNYEIAERAIISAKYAGADAIKLQTYTPDTITIKSDRPEFVIREGSPWDGRTLYDLYSETYTPWEWQPTLKKLADSIGLTLFSTPFDKTAVDFLEKMNVPCYKISSPELIDIPLIKYIASKNKPIILSTGAATQQEIYHAAIAAGIHNTVILYCVSKYPAKPEYINLNRLKEMTHWTTPIGFSDHTTGTAAAILAVSQGACMVEKHFMISGGEDSSFSLGIDEFEKFVNDIREAEEILKPKTEQADLDVRPFRRSLYVVKETKFNEVFTDENVKSIRPAAGLEPSKITYIVGQHAARNIEAGTPLRYELVKEFND